MSEQMRAALEQIERWSRAYPLANFPKPDLQRAHKLLQAGGISLDAVSADAMRHVIEGVGDIARRALDMEATMDGSYLQAGYTAARTGSDFNACPHPLGSDAAIQWMIGHWVWQLEQDNTNARGTPR